MDFEKLPAELANLTPEQMEKAKQCTSAEELFALVKEEGIALTDEQLEAIAGGSIIDWNCPFDCYFHFDSTKRPTFKKVRGSKLAGGQSPDAGGLE